MSTSTTRVRHPIFARIFVRTSKTMEREGAADHRRRMLAGLAGRVIEVGAGSGLNFAHYPPGVTEVLAVEPEPYLREEARRSAARAPVQVTIVDGVAERLPAGDGEFDAAIASLVLCSVADQQAVLTEMRRVIRPGAELRFYEHVQADKAGMRRVQRVLDATVWPRILGGCHSGRDTVAAIEAAGFELRDLERFRFPESRLPNPTSAHVVGIAVRPL